MKGIFKRLFNKTTNRQKPLGEIVIGVEIENNSEFRKLAKETTEALNYLNHCLDKLNEFELKVSTSRK
ncbi:hypothetical protein QM915_00320 [Streptococcus infantis]|jgi:hypothetical protein|uniref:hypothetical protein n=1 Tax=Streptococcus infantis TaxID=68892 RepID=UPI0020637E3D|nr:MAG TPA: hypothetical protein [Caudoviricetes sp.]DAW79125.1 MAG TPA: hypothetical protein [Caudoviricetes sp.]